MTARSNSSPCSSAEYPSSPRRSAFAPPSLGAGATFRPQKPLSTPRRQPSPVHHQQNPPSPAQMGELYAAFNACKEKFKPNILALGANLKAEELVAKHGWFHCRQFDNEANADMHSRTTAPEILRDFAGRQLDWFVTGCGTGGTLKGVARVLKAHANDARRIDEIYLVTLCRPPSEVERQACLKYVRESATPTEGLRGVMWSLLNTREFLLQH